MKKLFSIILIGFTMFAFAQNTSPNKGKKTQMTPEQQAITQTKHMALALDLTEKQQSQVLALNKKMAVERDAIRTQYRGSQKDGTPMTSDQKFEMKNKMLDFQLKHQTEMKKILNEKQYEDWKTMQQKNRKGHGMKGGKKGDNKNQKPQNNR
jgi:hypothetical protein